MHAKTKLFTIIFSFCFAFFLIIESLYLFVLPSVLLKHISSFDFKKNCNISSDIKNLKIKTYPDFSIKFSVDDLSLTGLEKSSLYLKNAKLKIFLPSLIKKKIALKYFIADDIKINSLRKNEKEFILLLNLLDNANKNDFEPKFVKTKINVKKYDLNFDDLYLNKKISLKGDNFNVKDFSEDKKLIASSKGAVYIDDKNIPFYFDVNCKLPFVKGFNYNKFKFNAQIFDFDLSILNPFLKLIDIKELKEIKSLSGKVNLKIDNSTDNNLKVNINTQNLYIKEAGEWNDIRLVNPAKFEFLIIFNNDELKINNYSILSKGLDIKGSGVVKNYDTDKPFLNITTKITNTDGKTFINFIPSEGAAPKHPNQVRMLKKYNYNGVLNGEFNVVGKLPEPNIYGDLSFKDVYLIEPIKNTKKATIDVKLSGDIVGVQAFIPVYNEYVNVVGYNKIFDDEYGEYYVTSSKNVDLSIVRKILVPISETFDFLLGPVPFFKYLTGYGDIILDIKGTMTNGSLIGRMNFRNANVLYEDVNAPITSAYGKVDFLDRKIVFKTDKAKFKNADVSLFIDGDVFGHYRGSAKITNADTAELLNVLNTSTLLQPYKEPAEMIDKIKGASDLDSKFSGLIPNVRHFSLVGNIKPEAVLKFKNNEVLLKGLNQSFKPVSGVVTLKNDLINIDAISKFFNSQISITGSVKGNKKSFKVLSSKMLLKDAVDFGLKSGLVKNTDIPPLPQTSSAFNMILNYKSKSKNLNLNDVSVKGNFLHFPKQNKELEIYNGSFSLNKGNLIFKNINLSLYKAKITLSGKLEHIFSKPLLTTSLKAKNLNLSLLNNVKKMNIPSKDLKKVLNNYSDYNGLIDIDVNIVKNKIKGSVSLSDIAFYHSKYKTPLKINNGMIEFYPDKIRLKAINAKFDDTPVFFDLTLHNYQKAPYFDGYFTIKLTEGFVNTYINSNLTYPIKVKGDIVLSSKFDGKKNNFNVYPKLKLQEGADIFYKGASFEDVLNIREINANLNITPQKISIKNFEYIKFVSSQNQNLYPLPILKLKGDILKKNDEYYFNSFNINTPNKANAKLLNILFGKSILKKGLIDCNLTLNGNIASPKVLGKLVFENFSMPLYDTLINNIYMNFKKDIVDISLKADFLNSDLLVTATLLNNPQTPIVIKNINISSGKINTNALFDFVSTVKPTETKNAFIANNKNQSLEMPRVIIEKGVILADDVIIKNSSANNLIAEFSLDRNAVLNFNKINFSVADGEITSNKAIININTGESSADFSASNIDSNKITYLLFDLKNQITGTLDGNLSVSTKGLTDNERLKNLKGYASFEIKKGSISKLGSLEYLLRANNIWDTGIMGLSLNKIINVLVPFDKGNFSSIKGSLQLSDAKVKNIEITSKGKNLSLFISGEYNLLSGYADFVILGKLTNKITSLLGPVGNISISSIFHLIPFVSVSDTKLVQNISKIPGIDLTDDDFKLFKATVNGDLNSDKVEKTFKWISRSKLFTENSK